MRIKHTYTRAKKLWIPYSGPRWPPPRAKQLLAIASCMIHGHDRSRWRRETALWFEYTDKPLPYAWRACKRCSLIEHTTGQQEGPVSEALDLTPNPIPKP
jgi:hypothetical protein